jgi:hypothetical protein
MIILFLLDILNTSGIMESSEDLFEVGVSIKSPEIKIIKKSLKPLDNIQDILPLFSMHLWWCKYSISSTLENSMNR